MADGTPKSTLFNTADEHVGSDTASQSPNSQAIDKASADNRLDYAATEPENTVEDDQEQHDTRNNIDDEQEDEHIPDQETYLRLLHHLYLALTLHPARPVVDLFHRGQPLYIDAYLNGVLTNEGDITNYPPTREITQNVAFKVYCEKLVPKSIQRIKDQADKNMVEEPKNAQLNREQLWKFIITPKMVDTYHAILEACKTDPDEEIDNPEYYGALWEFLEETVADQYDFDNWQHVSAMKPARMLKQKPLLP
jgi:hypothetical protein